MGKKKKRVDKLKKKRSAREDSDIRFTCHLDSCILMSYIIEDDTHSLADMIFRRLRADVEKYRAGVIISFLTIGETINEMREKELDETYFNRLFSMLDALKADLKPLVIRDLELAQEIIKRDDYIHITDALIVAQALGDNISRQLYTFDGAIHKSLEIPAICKRLRDDGQREGDLDIKDSVK